MIPYIALLIQPLPNTKNSLRKIRDMLKKDEVELSVSSYDTAWVAMVPSQNSSKQPLFPQCLNWIMENQQPDGSWAFDPAHPLLIKDSLSSTLACLLALHKWNVGDKLVHKGLDFIASNIWAATDKHQRSPRGFDIIFPGMIDHARDTGLNLPFNNSSIEGMLLKRDLEIKSFQGETNRLAYVAEGLTRLNDWQELMKYQRSNGSLFNSPSATAAAFIHFHDGKCLDYLSSLVKKFDKAVPTIYPLNIYPRLYMIDNLAKLGIDGHFTEVIATTLDDIYRILNLQMDYALKHSYANLERIESRRYIESYSVDDIALLKTSYRYLNIDNKDLLTFSFQDFNECQAIYRKEMKYLEKWVEEYSFKNLKFARQTIAYTYFSIAAVLPDPHLSDARISWAQNCVLTTVVDDFFDFGGSMEEILNLIELVHRWDDHSTIGFKSKDVEILFYSIYGTTNDIADKARKQLCRFVRKHLIDIWIDLLDTMLKEAEWARNKLVPTMYEYITNGYVSFGLGPIILTSLYFLGFKLSEQVVETKEYNNLFMHLSMIGRLLNDRASVTREGAQGKLNSVSLTIEHDRGAITEKEAQEEVARLIESHRRELLRMTSNILHLFYLDDDGYSSPHKMVSAVNAVISEPILLPPYSKLD
ncbi:hypothetical protein P3X46_019883 [Hevea brasiliensis]|uniref:Uncharacterized protein n=1 Tax=Hevea brasiliensis TaxID=3981 RepID=A0ABQ9LM15_HEVBR|nr:hypothetical protein P3X46_019883 [Hevea brasiliensis]